MKDIPLINILFENEFYSSIQLGDKDKKYFGIISFNDHHVILSESNCKKLKNLKVTKI